MTGLPELDPAAADNGGTARLIWVEDLITERNGADGLAADRDEAPPIPGG